MKKLLLVLAIAGMVSAPGLASGQQLFDFNGQALVPSVIGNPLTAYLPIDDAGVIDTPLPLDFDNYEYTIVVSGLPLATVDGLDQTFGPGTIVIYEDNATPWDYANPATFSDGTPILSGTLYGFYRDMILSSFGAGQGYVDWTGGTRLGELAPADQTGWTFLVQISTRSSDVEPGYDENWNGKTEPLEPVVPAGVTSVGEFKTRHQ